MVTVDEVGQKKPIACFEFGVEAKSRLDENGIANACAERAAQRKNTGGDTETLIEMAMTLQL